MWYAFKKGQVQGTHAVKRFQGMGGTTLEAKYAAASSAVIKLGDMMPGKQSLTGFVYLYQVNLIIINTYLLQESDSKREISRMSGWSGLMKI